MLVGGAAQSGTERAVGGRAFYNSCSMSYFGHDHTMSSDGCGACFVEGGRVIKGPDSRLVSLSSSLLGRTLGRAVRLGGGGKVR